MKALFTLITIIALALMGNVTPEMSAQDETKVILVESVEDVKHLNDSKALKVTVSKSLNLATSKSIKKMAIAELKAKAAAKGYTHLLIEDTKAGMAISKRNYKVVLKGVAYK